MSRPRPEAIAETTPSDWVPNCSKSRLAFESTARRSAPRPVPSKSTAKAGEAAANASARITHTRRWEMSMRGSTIARGQPRRGPPTRGRGLAPPGSSPGLLVARPTPPTAVVHAEELPAVLPLGRELDLEARPDPAGLHRSTPNFPPTERANRLA